MNDKNNEEIRNEEVLEEQNLTELETKKNKDNKKKYLLAEKIIFIVFCALFVLTLLVILISDIKFGLKNFGYAIDYSFISLFKGEVWKIIAVILAILTIGGFVTYWILQSRKFKRYSFGPLYFVLFFISFLFANGYYNAVLEFNFGVVLSIILFQYCLLSTIASGAFYLLTIEPKNKN